MLMLTCSIHSESFAADVVKVSDPIADARHAVKMGDYSLHYYISGYSGTGRNYFGIFCSASYEVIDQYLNKSSNQVFSNFLENEKKTELLKSDDYWVIYNRTIISDESFPLIGSCYDTLYFRSKNFPSNYERMM
jgi:hypothetical protein